MQPVQPMTEKPAKKSNGCLIALAILGGLFLLGGVIVGVVLYGVATSEEGQKVMKLMGGGIQMAQKARNAPGAAELRGIGCDEAMVMDLREVKQLADELDARQQGKMPDDDVMVTCALAFGSRRLPRSRRPSWSPCRTRPGAIRSAWPGSVGTANRFRWSSWRRAKRSSTTNRMASLV